MRQRKTIPILLAAWLTACAPATPLPTSTPAPTFTPLDTPTNTNTPAPTASATIVRIPTQDFNQPTFTPFVLQFLVDGQTATPFFDVPPGPGPGFLSIEYSPKKIFWGGCQQNSVTVRAEVEDPDEVFSVLIFVRVKDFKEEDYTPWTTGEVMLDRGQGEFTKVLYGSKIRGHNHYLRAWGYFQLVATNIEGEVIGRSRVFEKAFDMYPCPCLTPITGCPIDTPKPTPTP